MIELRRTELFDRWLRGLRDLKAKAKIEVRLDRLALGNAGDVRPVGSGISELRIDYGPGYRIYVWEQRREIVILLCGGDKHSQAADIRTAKSAGRATERVSHMPLDTKPYDSADYLDSDEAVAAYFDEALATEDASFVAHALGVIARARGMTRVAQDAGLSRESLYKALSEKGNPELTTMLRVLKALGLKLAVRHLEGT